MTTPPSQNLLQQGLSLQQQGRAAEAEALYRQVIAQEPGHAQALWFLGLLAAQRGDGGQALDAFDKILALGFAPPAIHFNRGVVLTGLNRFEEAVAAFDKELAIQPSPDGWNNRGAALQSLQRWPEALKSFDAALALKPDYAPVWVNRGAVLDVLERHEEALAAYERALAIAPGYAQAWISRGAVLHQLERHEEALASFNRAITLEPRHAIAFVNRGMAQEKLGLYEQAVDSYAQALSLEPDHVAACLSRGRILCTKLRRTEEALRGYDALLARRPDCAAAYHYRADAWRLLSMPDRALQDCDRSVALEPASAEMRMSRGVALMNMGRFGEAMADFDHAIALDPDDDGIRFQKSLLLLLQGDFAQGLPLYESRQNPRVHPGPRLCPGQEIAGRTLFISWEQGHGDVIHFCRYAMMAQAAGAQVVMSVPGNLMRVLRGLGPAVTLIADNAAPDHYDFQIPMLSLPHYFGTGPQNIPAPVPYLRPEPALAEKWRAVIGEQGFRVGLNWEGHTLTSAFPLREAAPLADVPGIRFISLQMGAAQAQIAEARASIRVESLGPDFNARPEAFVDSAAVMANLDLVISCDTAAAHLAGALGRPVWTALSYAPDWRWQMNRDDTPWYPGMTLFRQAAPGDWRSIFQTMASRLAALQLDVRLG